jgi:hypothetical protein
MNSNCKNNKYVSLHDPKAFLIGDKDGNSALHLVAQYSESVDLLRTISQTDSELRKKTVLENHEYKKPLALLCRRAEFVTFF